MPARSLPAGAVRGRGLVSGHFVPLVVVSKEALAANAAALIVTASAASEGELGSRPRAEYVGLFGR
jgi:hypothetical protein